VAFTAKLGTSESRLGNIVLGLGSASGGQTASFDCDPVGTGYWDLRAARVTQTLLAVLRSSSDEQKARVTQTLLSILRSSSDEQKIRVTQTLLGIIYDPELGRAIPHFDPVGFGEWDIASEGAAWDCDPVGRGRWVPPPPTAAVFDCNPVGTGEWASILGALVAAFNLDPIGEGEWDALVGGDAAFNCDPVGHGEWLPRVGALATPCVAGDGVFDGEQNYVF